jgi:hypothetical protein
MDCAVINLRGVSTNKTIIGCALIDKEFYGVPLFS